MWRSQEHTMFVWHAVVAIAVRLLLVLLGAGEALIWQPEVTTPANTILKTREGLRLLQLGASPYDGVSCHVPPLWLALMQPVALHPWRYVIPNVICDIIGAAALYAAAAALFNTTGRSQQPRDLPWLSALQLVLLYLYNPFTVLSCVAGTLTSAENAAVLVAVAGACRRNGPLAGLGLALGAYLGLHPLLLLVPVLLMLWRGSEDPLQAVPQAPLQDSNMQGISASSEEAAAGARASAAAGAGSGTRKDTPAAVRQRLHNKQQQQHPDTQAAQIPSGHGPPGCTEVPQCSWVPCLWCLASLVACSTVLLVLSDQVLQQHPDSQCLHPVLEALQEAFPSSTVAVLFDKLGSCWAGRVYGLTLFLQDLTPNIGLWWYFFTEVFTEFQPFFLFVFHSFAVILMVPVAVRFSGRPLFVAWVQLFISCMFRPYACVGDMVPWLVLLPLLQQQLQGMKLRMFLINSFVLLVVLGPAMWHQWIIVDSANANFFYSITLLLGVWCTVFLMQMLRLTCLLDRWLAGKGPAPTLLSSNGQAEADDGAVVYAALLLQSVSGSTLPEGGNANAL